MSGKPFYVVLTDSLDAPQRPQLFVECEDADGKSVKVGGMRKREDGYWVLGPFVEYEGPKEKGG